MFCFKKAFRLLKKQEFNAVFENAEKISMRGFVVLYKKNQLSHARLGFAITKKNVARAHERNRIKRIVRESFRHTKLQGVDIIFLAKPGLSRQNNASIFSNISKAWEKLSK